MGNARGARERPERVGFERVAGSVIARGFGQRILSAARELSVAEGVRNVSLRVADRIEFSVAVFCTDFRCKDASFFARSRALLSKRGAKDSVRRLGTTWEE